MSRLARLATVLLPLWTACSSQSSPQTPVTPSGSAGGVRVLMLTATAGFRHDSIATAQQVLARLASSSGFTITATEDLSLITAANLTNFDVLFFALTSGNLPLSDAQKADILAFVSRGGGFLGVHSATDTLYDWAEYEGLIGARFKEHPWTRIATVIVEDRTHPTTSMLGGQFSIEEEFYTFQENPRPRVQVLLRLDAGSVGASGDYPLAWTRAHGNGRVYYNALGHFPATWNSTLYQQQLVGAIRWAANR